MKISLFCAAVLLACALPLHAAETREQSYRIGADVDSQERVVATQFEADVPAPIASLLAGAVKQWQFVPARRGDHAVTARTFIQTKLRVGQDGQGRSSARIGFEGNGPRLDRSSMQPQDPKDAIRAGQSAFTLLDATVQPDGQLSDMTVSSKFESWSMLPSFKTAVLAAAKKWHATPELVDGEPVTTRLRVPVNFTLDQPKFTARQIKLLREAARTNAAEADPSAIPLPSEQAVAFDSPLQPSAVATIISAP